MRKPSKLYSLARPKLRQSWNKLNLYNMSRNVGREPHIVGIPTFFQQKWAAKAKARGYHGEHIPEKKWVRLFSRRLLSAVEMPPQYLAAHDGSEQSAGRGSGLSTTKVTASSFSKVPKLAYDSAAPRFAKPGGDVNEMLAQEFPKMTPYMQMTFAPLERRLDTAVFRALFASSLRQARQFVVHGAVKVNGKKMVHAQYQLNPGDMFQVDVEKVLYATGKGKTADVVELHTELKTSIEETQKEDEEYVQNLVGSAAESDSADQATAEEGSEAVDGVAVEVGDAAAAEDGSPVVADSLSEEDSWRLQNRQIKYLVKQVRSLLQDNPRDLTANHKVALRKFRTAARRYLSLPEGRANDGEELLTELRLFAKSHDVMRQTFQQFLVSEDDPSAEIEEATERGEEAKAQAETSARRRVAKALKDLPEEQKEKAVKIMGESQLTNEDIRSLGRLLRMDEENPVDHTKGYATPWEPRPYMSPFAFIPRYLEVNPTICAAVYLRHPVARKGMAEVPTPFNYLTSQLAHNWYLGRG